MSGLLDNKVRILDTIVTSLGRQQLSYGGLNIKYVSFSDSATFYKKDIVSGTQDSTQRAYFEASDLLQDQITLTADDSGKLLPFQNTNDVNIKAGQFIQYSYMPITSSILTGSSDTAFTLQGDDFATLSETLLQSSIDNFTNLQLIGTFDKLFDDDGFDIGSKQLEFIISNNSPIVDNNKFIANVTNIDSIFSDVRFSQIDNFKFLPPINKTDTSKKSLLGNYRPIGQTTKLTEQMLNDELSFYDKHGCSRVFSIDPTSNQNRLMIQIFEFSNDTSRKLEIVDIGIFSKKHYYFIGKLEIDDNFTHTFIHLFTLVFGDNNVF